MAIGANDSEQLKEDAWEIFNTEKTLATVRQAIKFAQNNSGERRP